MKRLKTVQTMCKVFKVLSTIAFIFAIIGAAGCAAGLITYAALGDTIIKIGGVTLKSIIWKETEVADPAVYLALATGAAICGSQIYLAYKAKKYFTHELEAGTPFTYDGARELRTLGILNMAVSVGTAIICGIVVAVIKAAFPEIGEVDFKSYTSVGLGLTFLLVSFVLEHGAELADRVRIAEGQYKGEL